MGRKILDKLTARHAEKDAPTPRRATAHSIGGLREGLERITNNSIRELDPSVIDQDGLRDRISIDDKSIDELAESIRQHGQHVPILVRPSEQHGRYRVVYGRRRLAATQKLGIAVKAIVRSLDDQASLIAQGQENSLRLDLSFIEKSIFIGAMKDAGYESSVIRDAVGLARQTISDYSVVYNAIPISVIEAVGPAPQVGRRKWMELSDLSEKHDISLEQTVLDIQSRLSSEPDSSSRFFMLLEHVSSVALNGSESAEDLVQVPHQTFADQVPISLDEPHVALDADAPKRGSDTTPEGNKPLPPSVGDLVRRDVQSRELVREDGRKIADLRCDETTLQVRVSLTDNPEFGRWMQKNADVVLRELHSRWQDESRD